MDSIVANFFKNIIIAGRKIMDEDNIDNEENNQKDNIREAWEIY